MEQKSSELSTTEVILICMTPIIVLLFIFGLFVFDLGFYEKRLAEDAMPATENMLDYFQDNAELEEGMFSADEVLHLLDVKILINGVFKFFSVFILVFLFLLLFLKDYNKYLRYSGILTITIPVLLYILPFASLFTLFHNVFFPQGNWVFPAGFALVNLYPFSFFYSFTFTTIWWLFVTGWGLLFLSFIVGKMAKFK